MENHLFSYKSLVFEIQVNHDCTIKIRPTFEICTDSLLEEVVTYLMQKIRGHVDISYYCVTCEKEIAYGFLGDSDSFFLQHNEKFEKHLKHEVLVRDRNNVPEKKRIK